MGERRIGRRLTTRVEGGTARRRPDELAVEEPLEIRVDGESVAVTMRTPGNDFDLALGFCLTEGIVARPDEVAAIRYCLGGQPNTYNVVDVVRRAPGPVADDRKRSVYVSSSCGVCGTASIDAVHRHAEPVHGDGVRVDATVLSLLPDRLREAQAVFDHTGGLHAAGLFSPDGELLALREDVGRHNAVDKVVGWAAGERRLPARGTVLLVSGRVAFEIVQKALIAGIPVVAAVSAPTTLAVQLAESAGMTLVGFLRGPTMNVYTGDQRVLTRPRPGAGQHG